MKQHSHKQRATHCENKKSFPQTKTAHNSVRKRDSKPQQQQLPQTKQNKTKNCSLIWNSANETYCLRSYCLNNNKKEATQTKQWNETKQNGRCYLRWKKEIEWDNVRAHYWATNVTEKRMKKTSWRKWNEALFRWSLSLCVSKLLSLEDYCREHGDKNKHTHTNINADSLTHTHTQVYIEINNKTIFFDTSIFTTFKQSPKTMPEEKNNI